MALLETTPAPSSEDEANRGIDAAYRANEAHDNLLDAKAKQAAQRLILGLDHSQAAQRDYVDLADASKAAKTSFDQQSQATGDLIGYDTPGGEHLQQQVDARTLPPTSTPQQ